MIHCACLTDRVWRFARAQDCQTDAVKAALSPDSQATLTCPFVTQNRAQNSRQIEAARRGWPMAQSGVHSRQRPRSQPPALSLVLIPPQVVLGQDVCQRKADQRLRATSPAQSLKNQVAMCCRDGSRDRHFGTNDDMCWKGHARLCSRSRGVEEGWPPRCRGTLDARYGGGNAKPAAMGGLCLRSEGRW